MICDKFCRAQNAAFLSTVIQLDKIVVWELLPQARQLVADKNK